MERGVALKNPYAQTPPRKTLASTLSQTPIVQSEVGDRGDHGDLRSRGISHLPEEWFLSPISRSSSPLHSVLGLQGKYLS